jgi:hypothetical protein
MIASRQVSRRQFLRGSGGAVVGLPFLPSLLPASAEAAGPGGPPRLILMAERLGAYGSSMHGTMSDTLTNKMQLYPGHEIGWSNLNAVNAGGKATLSPILKANANTLTPALVKKMNVLRGFDAISWGGHNEGALGNLGGPPDKGAAIPSIDQFVGYSPTYFAASGKPVERAIVSGHDPKMNYNHQNPATRSAEMVGIRPTSDPGALFSKLFSQFTVPVAGNKPPVVDPKPAGKLVVDHVLDDYKFIRDNRRLSSADKRKLDAHMTMLLEVQRRAMGASGGAGIGAGPGCAKPGTPKGGGLPGRNPAGAVALYQSINDVIAAAMKCGITRVATVSNYGDAFTTFNGDWHSQSHASAGMDNSATQMFTDAYQTFFEGVFVDLASKLDTDEGAGRTYLDNSIMLWLNEHGAKDHGCHDVPVISFGGASGQFKTGMLIDYRNRATPAWTWAKKNNYYAGVPIHQMWTNILYSLGIPPAEWAKYSSGTPGAWGPCKVMQQPPTKLEVLPSHYVAGVLPGAANKLPVWWT